MESNKRYFWLKLHEDFFKDELIEWLEEQENGKEYCLLYLKLCLKSLKKDGYLIREVGTMLVPYTAEKIAEITKTKLDTVLVALTLFEKLGLIIKCEDGRLYIPQVALLTGSESSSKEAIKKRVQRERKKLAKNNGDILSPTLSPETGTECPTEYRDKSIEYRDKSIDIKKKKIITADAVITEKEKSDGSDEAFANICDFYQNNIHPFSGPNEFERLQAVYKECGFRHVMTAMEAAIGKHALNIRFVEKVSKYERDGISFEKKKACETRRMDSKSNDDELDRLLAERGITL